VTGDRDNEHGCQLNDTAEDNNDSCSATTAAAAAIALPPPPSAIRQQLQLNIQYYQ